MKFKIFKPNYEFENKNLMNCDEILGGHIKEPFPRCSGFFLVIVGIPGSGKTSMMVNLLTSKNNNRVYNNVFNKIFLVMPSKSQTSIKNNPFEEIPEEQKFERFNYEVIESIQNSYEEYIKNKKERIEKKKKIKPFHMLLICDDITATLKNKNIENSLLELTTNRRHFKLSIIIMVQYLRSIPKNIRFQISHCVFFKPSNELDAKIIREEFVNMKANDFIELKDFVWKDRHDFLFMDKNNNSYYKNLSKIEMMN